VAGKSIRRDIFTLEKSYKNLIKNKLVVDYINKPTAAIGKYVRILINCHSTSRSQWPRGVRRRSAAASLLGLRVRIQLGAWMFISYVHMLCYPV
jgi:hypothetical protein